MPRPRHSAKSSAAILEALKGSIAALRWGLVLLLAIYLTSGITVVKPHESALLLRFGRLQPKIYGSGLVLALPEPMDQVVKLPTQTVHELPLDAWAARDAAPAIDPATGLPVPVEGIRLHPARDGYSLTGDTNIVQGRFSLRYLIADPAAWFAVGEGRQALLEALGYRAAAIALATTPVDDALSGGREILQDRMLLAAQGSADALRLGLKFTAFQVRELIPTRHVLPEFEAVVSAQVDARTQVEDAKAYQAEQLPGVDAESYRIRQEAASAGRTLVARARGESASFLALLAEYRAHPALVRSRLRAETLRAVLPQVAVKSAVPLGRGDTRIFLDPTPPGAP